MDSKHTQLLFFGGYSQYSVSGLLIFWVSSTLWDVWSHGISLEAWFLETSSRCWAVSELLETSLCWHGEGRGQNVGDGDDSSGAELIMWFSIFCRETKLRVKAMGYLFFQCTWWVLSNSVFDFSIRMIRNNFRKHTVLIFSVSQKPVFTFKPDTYRKNRNCTC